MFNFWLFNWIFVLKRLMYLRFMIIGFIEYEIQKYVKNNFFCCINVLLIFWGVLVQL